MVRKKNKWVLPLLTVFIVIGLFSYFFVYTPYLKIKAKGMEVVASAMLMKDALKSNNIDEVKSKITDVSNKYQVFSTEAKQVYWLANIPFLGSYVKDFKAGVAAGDSVIKAGVTSVDTISPYADLIGFRKGGATFIEKSADDRLQTAVLTLDKMLSKIDTISVDIDNARKELDTIDETRYPEKIGNTEVRAKIKDAKDQFDSIASLFVDAKPLLKKIPNILGSENEKTYLFLFQNDKELRPTGGFLTAYAIFTIRNGKFTIVKSSDIYTLDASIANHPVAPREILTYHKGVSQFVIRDSNLSPDLVKSIDLFNSLYSKSSLKVNYDGIFVIDTNVLVDTLTVLGDTEVDGVVFSSKSDKRCNNCPQVIYELLDNIDRPVGYVKENRKGILGDMLHILMQKALGFSPSKYWGKLFSDVIMKNLNEKHMMVYMKDPEVQQSLEKIDYAGRIEQTTGDYLHINDANFAGAKSNLFVTQSVTSVTDIKGDGTAERTVTIEYKNPFPASDCNLERGGLCLNAILRDWLRVYVPEGSKLTSFQGSEMKNQTYNDLGKTVFEGFLQVKPMGKSTVVVKYTLPNKMKESDYTLLIQKQPGTIGNTYDVKINGKSYDVNTRTNVTDEKNKLIQDVLIKAQ
jgi:hypothetical protein